MPTYYIKDNIEIKVESYQDRRNEPHRFKNKIYMWPEETVLENLENRRSRPYNEWKKDVK